MPKYRQTDRQTRRGQTVSEGVTIISVVFHVSTELVKVGYVKYVVLLWARD